MNTSLLERLYDIDMICRGGSTVTVSSEDDNPDRWDVFCNFPRGPKVFFKLHIINLTANDIYWLRDSNKYLRFLSVFYEFVYYPSIPSNLYHFGFILHLWEAIVPVEHPAHLELPSFTLIACLMYHHPARVIRQSSWLLAGREKGGQVSMPVWGWKT